MKPPRILHSTRPSPIRVEQGDGTQKPSPSLVTLETVYITAAFIYILFFFLFSFFKLTL